MNPNKTRIRMPRAVITAGCLAALASPGVAAAMPQHGDPSLAIRHENGAAVSQVISSSDSSGARLDHRGLGQSHYVLPMSHVTDIQSNAPAAATPAYKLPSSFKTDAQTSEPGTGKRTYALPSNFQSDAQTPAPSSSPSSSPGAVSREIRTITSDSDRTLAIVLAACALGIALCGTGFAAIRLTQLQRRMVRSSS